MLRNRNAAGFFLYFSATVLIVAGIIGISFGTQATRSMKDSIIDTDQRMLRQVYTSMEAVMQQSDQLRFMLVTDPSVADFIKNYTEKNTPALIEVSKKLNNMLMASPYLVGVDIYYPALGVVYAVNCGVFAAEQYPDPEILKIISEDGVTHGRIYSRDIYDVHTNRMVTVTTELYPNRSLQNGLYTITIINQNTLLYANMLNNLSTRKETTLAVFDDTGSILAASSQWDWAIPEEELYGMIGANPNGYLLGELGGRKIFAAYHTDSLRGWKYVSTTPVDALFSPIAALQRLSVVITIMGAVIGIAISIVFSRSLYKPLLAIAKMLGGDRGATATIRYIETSIDRLKSHNASIEKTLAEYMPIMTNRFLSDLLKGYYRGSDNISERLRYHSLYFDEKALYCVFVLLIDTQNEEDQSYSQHQMNLFSIYVMEQLQQLFENPGDGEVVDIRGNEIGIIVRVCEAGEANPGRRAEALGRRLAASISEGMKHIVDIGVGGVCALPSIDDSYAQAHAVLAQRYMRDRGRILYYHLLPAGTQHSEYPIEAENHLISAIHRKKRAQVQEQLAYILSILYLPGEESESRRTFHLIRLLGVVEKALREAAGPARSTDPYNEMLSKIRDMDTLREWLSAYIFDAFDHAQEQAPDKERRLSDEIVSYIRENFGDSELSLNKLSSEFYFSAPYISRLFREETGVNIKQYITQMRMEKAKELLACEDGRKINEIGALVGYDKVHSFLKQFKDYTGLTPGQYRERLAEIR